MSEVQQNVDDGISCVDTDSLVTDNTAHSTIYTLINLPPELLVKILSYLSTRDKMKIPFVCQRFKDIWGEPLLWRVFVLPDYEPRHVSTISNNENTWRIRETNILSFPRDTCRYIGDGTVLQKSDTSEFA